MSNFRSTLLIKVSICSHLQWCIEKRKAHLLTQQNYLVQFMCSKNKLSDYYYIMQSFAWKLK